MSDLEQLAAAATVLVAVTLLSLAHDFVTSGRVVDRVSSVTCGAGSDGARVHERSVEATGSLSIPMGERSTEERPPRLWPCEKAVLAGSEPRNASPRKPRSIPQGSVAVIPGLAAGETALVDREKPSGVEGHAAAACELAGPGFDSPARGNASEHGNGAWKLTWSP